MEGGIDVWKGVGWVEGGWKEGREGGGKSPRDHCQMMPAGVKSSSAGGKEHLTEGGPGWCPRSTDRASRTGIPSHLKFCFPAGNPMPERGGPGREGGQGDRGSPQSQACSPAPPLAGIRIRKCMCLFCLVRI